MESSINDQNDSMEEVNDMESLDPKSFYELFRKDLFATQKQTQQSIKQTIESTILPELQAIRNDQAKLNDRVSEIEQRLDQVVNTSKAGAVQCEKLQSDMKKLSEVQSALQEQQDRIRKLNNVIVMGLPEDENAHTTLTKVMQFLLPNNKLHINANIRIGMNTRGNARPIRVQLNSNNEVHHVLKQAKLLKEHEHFHNIYVRKDLTRLQQEERRKQSAVPASQSSSQPSSSLRQKTANKNHGNEGEPERKRNRQS